MTTALIQELASRAFQSRDVAHRAHFRTGSFSAHKALEKFYEDVIDSIDEIVEVWQGQFGLLGEFEVNTEPVADVAAYLTAEADWIATMRDEIAGSSMTVANLIDELGAIYRRAVYRLTYLS